jgi:putative acetyltransferase
MACEIAIEDPRQPELLALLADDDAHYAALYPAESNHLLDAAVLAAADVTFLVARVSHRAAGFGALLRHGVAFGEIKRMYVAPAMRGRKLGRLLLNALEERARCDGLPACGLRRAQSSLRRSVFIVWPATAKSRRAGITSPIR